MNKESNVLNYINEGVSSQDKEYRLKELIIHIISNLQTKGLAPSTNIVCSILENTGIKHVSPTFVTKIINQNSQINTSVEIIKQPFNLQNFQLKKKESISNLTPENLQIKSEEKLLWKKIFQNAPSSTQTISQSKTESDKINSKEKHDEKNEKDSLRLSSQEQTNYQIPVLKLIQRLTESVLGIHFNQFIEKMLLFNEKYNQNPVDDESIKKLLLQKRIKLLKEEFNIIQKQNRTLQNALRNIENRMSLGSSISTPFSNTIDHFDRKSLDKVGDELKDSETQIEQRPQLKLKINSDLNEFQMAVLKHDIERFTIHYERLKTKIEQLQNDLLKFQERSRKIESQKHYNSHTEKNVSQSLEKKQTKKSNDQFLIKDSSMEEQTNFDETQWHSLLDFSSMQNEDRFKFLFSIEQLFWPQKNMIRNMFERNVGIVRFTDLIPNTYFWRLWFQKRQVHEYADRLKKLFRASYIPSPATILDERLMFDRLKNVEPEYIQLQQWPIEDTMFRDYSYVNQMEKHRDQMLLQSMYMLREEDIPIFNHNIYDPREAISFLGQSIQWQDPYFLYIYESDFINREKKSIEFATNNNLDYWNETYDSFIELSTYLWEEIHLQNQSSYEKTNNILNPNITAIDNIHLTRKRDQIFKRYVYSLCNISNDTEKSLWIISKVLKDENILTFSRFHRNMDYQFSFKRKLKYILPGKNIQMLASTIIEIIHHKLIKKMKKLIDDPIQFMKSYQSSKILIQEYNSKSSMFNNISSWYPISVLENNLPLNEKLTIFVENLFSTLHDNIQSIEYNIETFESLLRYRLYQEEEDFWKAVSSEASKRTPFNMDTNHIENIYENDYFSVSPLHFLKRKGINYIEKLKLMIISIIDHMKIIDVTNLSEDALQKSFEALQKTIKQQAKLQAKQYKIVNHNYFPTVTRIITEESSKELKERIKYYFLVKKQIKLDRVERNHFQEFCDEEIKYIFTEKYPYLLDFRPESHSIMVEYRHSRPFFALSALAKIEKERLLNIKKYTEIDPEDLDAKLDFAMTNTVQPSQKVYQAILRHLQR